MEVGDRESRLRTSHVARDAAKALAAIDEDFSCFDSALRDGWATVGFARKWLEEQEPISEPDDERIQQEADIEDALDLAASALWFAEQSRSIADANMAAEAVSDLASLLGV
jgi:hypothetical protein